MALTLMLALQAAGQPLPSGTGAADFDLARLRPASPDPCRGQNASEIVVCGRREAGDVYRLKEMPRTFEEKPLRAETSLGKDATGVDATAGVYVDSVTMPDGQISKRATIKIKLPF
jgi:hypothetical protein